MIHNYEKVIKLNNRTLGRNSRDSDEDYVCKHLH